MMKNTKKCALKLVLMLIFLSLLSCTYSNDANRSNLDEIDLYRMEVAYAVSNNWQFSDKIASDEKPVVSIVFKVLPDGEIKEIFYTKRSGNSSLDESAYKAIIKTNPTKPFPKSIKKPYMNIGLSFGPNGVK
jgi:colicin import membrane protein